MEHLRQQLTAVPVADVTVTRGNSIRKRNVESQLQYDSTEMLPHVDHVCMGVTQHQLTGQTKRHAFQRKGISSIWWSFFLPSYKPLQVLSFPYFLLSIFICLPVVFSFSSCHNFSPFSISFLPPTVPPSFPIYSSLFLASSFFSLLLSLSPVSFNPLLLCYFLLSSTVDSLTSHPSSLSVIQSSCPPNWAPVLVTLQRPSFSIAWASTIAQAIQNGLLKSHKVILQDVDIQKLLNFILLPCFKVILLLHVCKDYLSSMFLTMT